MRLSATEKKRKQRERQKRGSRVIQVEIVDWGAWCEVLRESNWLHGRVETEGSIRTATEAFIWDLCRHYRQEQAHEELQQIRAPITGLIDREVELGPAQLIRAKHVKLPGPDTKIEPDTYFALIESQFEYDELDPLEAEATVAEGGFQIKDT